MPPSSDHRLFDDHPAIATLAADPTEASRLSWRLGRDVWQQLAAAHAFPVPERLWAELDVAMSPSTERQD